MAKAKAPYTFPHKSRKAMIDYLTGVGGYGDRMTHYPIEFNVSVCADLDFDNMFKKIRQEHLCPTEYADGTRALALYTDALKRVYEEAKEHLWVWSVEDAASLVTDSDCYNMLYDTGEIVGAKWSFAGRGGKHLVLVEAFGISVSGMSDREFEDMLRGQRNPNGWELDEHCDKLKRDHTWVVPTDKLTKLYRYIRQCEIDFTSKKATAEVEYQAAFRLASMTEDTYATLYGTDAEHTESILTEDARTVLDSLGAGNAEALRGFRRLCTAAGIDISDLVENHESCTN